MFDPQKYFESSTEEPMETTLSPIPVGEYTAVVRSVKIFPIKDKQTGMERTNTIRTTITWDIDDKPLEQQLGRTNLTVQQTVFIDFDDNGSFATGRDKNVQLGRLREALNLNSGRFTLQMLEGAGPARIAVHHEPDSRDDSLIYAKVKNVTRI